MQSNPTTQDAGVNTNAGWFRAMRGDEPMELLRAAPFAFILAYVIAARGQYRIGFNRYNLGPGEALLGDHENYGMSIRQYRTAKQQLSKWGFATFKATSKGTIGKLIDTRLFAIFRLESDNQDGTRETSSRQAGVKQATSSRPLPRSEEQKSFKNDKNKRIPVFSETKSIDLTK